MDRDVWSVNPPFSGGTEKEPPGPVALFLRSFFSRFDLLQIIPAALLLATGILFIYGTGQQVGGTVSTYWLKQLFYLFIGLSIWLTLTFIDYRWLGLAGAVMYPVSVILLCLVFVPKIGIELNGARRWIDAGPITFQPSEFAKLTLILVVSWILSFKKANINKLPCVSVILLVMAIPFLLIYREPDLGTSLVLCPVVGAIAFAANLKFRYILIILALVVIAAPLVYSNLHTYQKERIKTFLDPERDPRNRGWNAIQAELTVGSGGLTGKGYMNGSHCMLGYLPKTVANSDFIFPVISEETGFAGAFTLLLMYGCLLFSIMRTALLASDPFGRYLCVGIGTLITIHVTVNIGMCIRLLPITGLPLPLVSYGGTFLVAMMTYLGIVQSVYAHREKDSFIEL